MSTVDLTQIQNLPDVMERVANGESLVIRSSGKDVGILVSTQDAQLLEVIEDYLDNQAADAAMTEGGERISYATLRRELGLA
jgi:antitoxin (DNA-binding transcriptional repressor) of toxin-antitoxin stability system